MSSWQTFKLSFMGASDWKIGFKSPKSFVPVTHISTWCNKIFMCLTYQNKHSDQLSCVSDNICCIYSTYRVFLKFVTVTYFHQILPNFKYIRDIIVKKKNIVKFQFEIMPECTQGLPNVWSNYRLFDQTSPNFNLTKVSRQTFWKRFMSIRL